MHVFDFYTAVQSANELASLLSKLGRHPLGTETIFDLDGTVRVIIPALSFEDYVEWACGQIRRGGAGEPDVSRALVRMLTWEAWSSPTLGRRVSATRCAWCSPPPSVRSRSPTTWT